MLIFIVVSVSFMMFELNNAALYILLCALFMCIAIMAACYGYFKEQNEIMENAVAQITEGINQIAGVIESNTATSEESAAASEELSTQANMLKELVGRFQYINE